MDTVFVPGAPRIALSVAGSGPLIVFLHGIGGHRQHWAAQVEFFSKDFKAVAWDARGYGDSGDYDDPLRFDDFADDLLRVLDYLEARKAHVVGLSMGGRIARSFALQHPGRVRTLTLANTSPGFDALSAGEVQRFVEERRNRRLDSLGRLLGSRAQPQAHAALKASFEALRKASYLKTLEASVSQDRAAPLENLAVPTLVIAGDEDPVYPQALARGMARRIPGAELVVLEGCGHLSNLEQPERFNDALLDFLSRRTHE
ncbi:MAG TPA: alpha/beta fold hydrolase [Burkholderiales bacterium]|nr:alpha/beta fold hydrolase [Burkholderiales bacterium]